MFDVEVGTESGPGPVATARPEATPEDKSRVGVGSDEVLVDSVELDDVSELLDQDEDELEDHDVDSLEELQVVGGGVHSGVEDVVGGGGGGLQVDVGVH